MFLNTREGQEEPPMEPGARWGIEPWEAPPPLKPHRFTTHANPRPFDCPATLPLLTLDFDTAAQLNHSHGDHSPLGVEDLGHSQFLPYDPGRHDLHLIASPGKHPFVEFVRANRDDRD